MTEPKKTQEEEPGLGRVHARFGWTLLLVSLAFGAGLETLEGFRWVSWVSDPWKQRLWSLAHFHGAALGLLNLIYVPWAGSRVGASRALRLGSAAMPLGFLLGGIAHHEGDPSLGIILAPVGALFILYTVFVQTLVTWRSPTSEKR